MRRPRPDAVFRDGFYVELYWHASRRCPKRCEYKGEHQPGEHHIEYRRKRDSSRPAPLLGLVKR